MASKPFKNPIIQIRGVEDIQDALKIFPFDYVCKFFMINNIRWDNKFPDIPQMIYIIHNLYDRIKKYKESGDYKYVEYKQFRVTAVNNQVELSFEFANK